VVRWPVGDEVRDVVPGPRSAPVARRLVYGFGQALKPSFHLSMTATTAAASAAMFVTM